MIEQEQPTTSSEAPPTENKIDLDAEGSKKPFDHIELLKYFVANIKRSYNNLKLDSKIVI